MLSSIFNFRNHRSRRLMFGLMLMVLIFGRLYSLGNAVTRDRLSGSYLNVSKNGRLLDISDKFLNYGAGVSSLSHEFFFYNVPNIVSPVKNADLLILGNSRAAMGFSERLMNEFAEKNHIRYFDLGFGFDEGVIWAAYLINKYDLHPKTVVINADTFFRPVISYLTYSLFLCSNWENRKERIEVYGKYFYFRELRKYFPAFFPHQRTPKSLSLPVDYVIFQSEINGTWHLIPPDYKTETNTWHLTNLSDVPNHIEFNLAKSFVSYLKQRNCRVIFTQIPYDLMSSARARNFAEFAQVPVIAPDIKNFRTWDGMHLDQDSSERFTRAFLKEFTELTMFEKNEEGELK